MGCAWKTSRLAALVVIAAASCGPSEPVAAPTQWPAGTALAVDDVAISTAEIDTDSVYVERIEPSAAAPQLRRLALRNMTLPRVIARMMAPEQHAAARRAAQAALAQLRAGTYPVGTDGNYGVVLNGNWEYLGLNLWGAAMDLADGAWSDVIEQPGHFCVARQLARIDGPVTMATQLELDVLTFAWMDAANAAARIEAEHERHVLTIVDPQWNAIVPELLKNRMRKKP